MLVTDLSDWNDHINWSHMIDKGVEGVIVKISEGRTLSELHGKHIAGASARGLPWGVYCYTHAQTTERAEEEAAVVIVKHWMLWDTVRRPWEFGLTWKRPKSLGRIGKM